ncbi:caspase family protein [Azospirillum sp. TSO35-2]|uniref:caspase family protein n=1 Tax=Azospirillum sp. TSO35-2 TaxID=716796 RepID=UPI000D60C68E|nr:caspase family protein [Azospirillum sp. TSO35-2]PWC39755.1 peptidase C14 [Azospirillum sp. TSO35-2]
MAVSTLGRTVALALSVFIWVSGPSWAGERRVALVLGNSAYQHAPRLPNPVNDAKAIADSLRDAGFDLIGGGAQLDLDKAGTEQAIRSFGGKLAGADVGLFYYAGHGVQTRGTNYLLPVSANLTKEADVRYELIDIAMVLDEMALAESRLNIVILDACRNNPFGGRGLRAVSPGLAQMQAPAGTIIAYATQPGAVAADGSGANSPYTEALSKALLKPGETVFDVFNDVGITVKRNTGGVQQPWVSASPIEGRFYFLGPTTVVTSTPAAAPAPAPVTADKEAMFWDSIKGSSNRGLFEAYLKQFPQGTFTPIAEAKIAELGAKDAPAATAAAAPLVTSVPGPLPTPADPVPAQVAALAAPPVPAPPSRPVDVSAIPYLSAKARDALSFYPGLPSPKALAISEKGNYAYFSNKSNSRSEDDVKRSALQYCQFHAEAPCTLYAVDDSVVLDGAKGFVPMPVEILGEGKFDPARVPFITDRARQVGMVNYQRNPGHKAVALTLTGRWATVWDMDSAEEASDAAVEKCEKAAGKQECMIYAVDDTIVFDEER